MLQPKSTRFPKMQKRKRLRISNNLKNLSFGKYAIIAKEAACISTKMIETIRRTLTRCFQRKGKTWIKIFPNISVSKKPAEVRMGKGKGSHSYWVCKLRAGQILFEIDGIPLKAIHQVTSLVKQKLPFSSCMIKKKSLECF